MHTNGGSLQKTGRKRRFLALFLLATAIILAALWWQRMSIAQRLIVDALTEQGIEAELDVTSLSFSQAILSEINLSSDGKALASVKQATVAYDWREALNGQIQSVVLEAPTIQLEWDHTGRLQSPSLPETSISGQSNAAWPSEGIKVRDGQVIAKSPWGEADIALSGQIHDPARFDMQGRVETTHINYQTSNRSFGGSLAADFSVKALESQADIQTTVDLSHGHLGDLSIRSGQADLDWAVTWGAQNISVAGRSNVTLTRILSPLVRTETSQMGWVGRVDLVRQGGLRDVDGDWEIDATAATLTDAGRRQALSATVTLNRALSDISSTAPFAPGLTSAFDQLLTSMNITGAGSLDLNSQEMRVSLSKPLHVSNGDLHAEIRPTIAVPLYVFEPSRDRIQSAFSARMNGPYEVTLNEARLVAKSKTGIDIAGVTEFETHLMTSKTWRAITDAGRPARLSPLTAKVSYTLMDDVRNVKLRLAADFDGDVPGGYATGLKARGDMRVRLKGDDLTVWFTPQAGTDVAVGRFATVTDWQAENLRMEVEGRGPIYQRNSKGGVVTTRLRNGTGELFHPARNMGLTFDFNLADVVGHVEDDTQRWDIQADKAHMVSDTIPAVGTDVSAKSLAVTAKLSPDDPLYFTMESPYVDLSTPLMTGTGFRVQATGTSEALRADYSGGSVQTKTFDLPSMPVDGYAEYALTAWSGQAQTAHPRAPDTPINIAYQLDGGEIKAQVKVVDLLFAEKGLQPKHLLPALGGQIAQVNGRVSADIDIGMVSGDPMTSAGQLTLTNISFGTLPGPVTGLNASLQFDSFMPPRTAGPQTVRIDMFDPGLPLQDGEIIFETLSDGVRLRQARWPMGDGYISLDPTDWRYSAPENRVTLRVEDVSVSEFLQDAGGENFTATGDVTGELPVVVSGLNVLVENGVLSVKDGGVIRYSSPQTNAATATNEVAGYAFDALKNFEYKSLEARLNGPLDGEIDLKLVFSGSNQEVLDGAEFLFNVNIAGQLFNIARSFQAGKGISSTVLDELKSRPPK